MATAAFSLASLSAAIAAPERCFPDKAAISPEAVGARDGMTLRLKDGREVRLAGVYVPTGLEDPDAARRATELLDAIVAGRRVTLFATKTAPDRYGRLSVQAVAEGSEWVQRTLVRRGAAYAMPGSGNPDCASELLAAEAAARAGGEGFWKEGILTVADGASVPGKFAAQGRFSVVEGTVRRVGESGGRLFLDFGARYREDFTIVIPREALAAFTAAGIDLRALSGRRVRARGMVFLEGGPAMELRVPAALELVGTSEG